MSEARWPSVTCSTRCGIRLAQTLVKVLVCIYIYIYRERERWMCVYIYICIYTPINKYVYIYIYICIYICVCIYIYIYIYPFIQWDLMIWTRRTPPSSAAAVAPALPPRLTYTMLYCSISYYIILQYSILQCMTLFVLYWTTERRPATASVMMSRGVPTRMFTSLLQSMAVRRCGSSAIGQCSFSPPLWAVPHSADRKRHCQREWHAKTWLRSAAFPSRVAVLALARLLAGRGQPFITYYDVLSHSIP